VFDIIVINLKTHSLNACTSADRIILTSVRAGVKIGLAVSISQLEAQNLLIITGQF
jgi:hypothetical protein